MQWAEFDVLTLNLRSARAQLVGLQGENETLRAELATLRSKAPKSPDGRSTPRLERELAELRAKLDSVSKEHAGQVEEKDRQIVELQRRANELGKLEKSLEELRFLKAAEFPDQYRAELDQSLESLLRAQVKKLEGELVHAGSQGRELARQLDDLRSELTTRNARITELEGTIEGYETAAAPGSLPADAISLQSTSTVSTQAPDSVVTILTNQRDRLKRQKEELEDRYTALHQCLEGQKVEASRLRLDNAKLFEQVKVMSGAARNRLADGFTVEDGLDEPSGPTQFGHETRSSPFRMLFQSVRLLPSPCLLLARTNGSVVIGNP